MAFIITKIFYSVLPGAEENENIWHPPEDRLGLMIPNNGNDGLATSFSNTRDIVGNGWGDLKFQFGKKITLENGY